MNKGCYDKTKSYTAQYNMKWTWLKCILIIIGFFLKMVTCQWYFGIFLSKEKYCTSSMNHDIRSGHMYVYMQASPRSMSLE